MLAAYRPLFAVPGAPSFIFGSVLARIGAAMFGVSVIVMVSSRQGSYELAGALTAVAVLVLAGAGPFIGRLIDKHGQRRIAVPFLLFAATCGFATATFSLLGLPIWTVFVGYALSAFIPEIGPLTRARWAHIYHGDEARLHTAMSFEQVLDEASFVLGPVLGVVLPTMLFPEAGLYVAEATFLVGMLLFLSARATEPPVVSMHDRPKGLAVRRPGLFVVALVLVMTGTVFGANEVVTVAVADEAGNKGFSSVILGLFALGSTVAGLIYGTRVFATSLTKRLAIAASLMFLLQAPILWLTDLRALAALMLVAGVATAPMLITSLSLSQKLVPRALVTEGMAVAITGILIGVAVGASVGGIAVERLGAQQAYVVPVTAALVSALLALGAARSLGRHEAAAERAALLEVTARQRVTEPEPA